MNFRTPVFILITALVGCAGAKQQQAISVGSAFHAADPEACGRAVNSYGDIWSACRTQRDLDEKRCLAEASQAQPTAEDVKLWENMGSSYKNALKFALDVAREQTDKRCMVAAGYSEYAPVPFDPNSEEVERARRNAEEAARAEHYSIINGHLCWSNHASGGKGLIVNCE